MSEKLGVLDLFAGGGGFYLGFELADEIDGYSFETVCAVDKNEYACQTLRSHFKERDKDPNRVILGDLNDEDTKKEILDLCNGQVDVIIGGPPCQSFSLIGPRSGYGVGNSKFENDSRDDLYMAYIDLVKTLSPSFIVFENVLGLASKKGEDGTPYVQIIRQDLESIGYTFENERQDKLIQDTYLKLNAADYGVPQNRRRIFLIGNNQSIKNPFPERTHGDGKKPQVTLWDTIGDLPELEAKYTFTDIPDDERDKVRKINEGRRNGEKQVEYHKDCFFSHYRNLDETGQEFLDFVVPDIPEHLTDHIARSHMRRDQRLYRAMKQGHTAKDVVEGDYEQDIRNCIKYDMSSFKDKYRKQSWNAPSTTIFAHLAKDGNRFIHPDDKQARTFTVREAARIQSFPDDYRFSGPRTAQYGQIGNAVPPLLAKRMAESLLRKFAGAQVEPVSKQSVPASVEAQ